MDMQTALAQLALELAHIAGQRDRALATVQELGRRIQVLEDAEKAEPPEPAGDA